MRVSYASFSLSESCSCLLLCVHACVCVCPDFTLYIYPRYSNVTAGSVLLHWSGHSVAAGGRGKVTFAVYKRRLYDWMDYDDLLLYMVTSGVDTASLRIGALDMAADYAFQVGGWVGMNRWGVRREWCMGQERERETLQFVTT
jgi:hypothetical protein